MDLKYRLYSVSSQTQEAPAGSLQNMQGHWESAINCTYPQELTVQFYIPIQTKNMKIVFHQYKIPKLVEVFVRCGKHQKYRKLGFIQPNDNSQSSYLQKQIKTVFFEFPCTFIKLVFHQNYKNQLNLFDQIAVSQLSFEGSCLPTSELSKFQANVLEELDTSEDEEDEGSKINEVEKSLPVADKQKKSQTFQSVLYAELFSMLDHAKKQAVQNQDFQRASYIKNTIQNFKQMEMEILRLQNQKQIALQNEQYDKCHQLKREITEKKQVVAFHIRDWQEQSKNQPNPLAFSKYSQSQGHNNRSYMTNRTNRIQSEQSIQSPVQKRQNNNYSNREYQNNYSNRDNQTKGDNGKIVSNSSNSYQKHQQQVVPALLNKGVKRNMQEQFYNDAKVNQSIMGGLRSPSTIKKDEEGPQQSIDMRISDINQVLHQFPQLQPLDFKTLKRYEHFFQFIGPQFWRLAVSQKYQKNWQLKSIALDQALNLDITDGLHVMGLLQLVSITILDNHTINIKKSLRVLQKLVDLPNKDFSYQNNLPRYCINTVLEALIHLFNDTKEEFRKIALEIYRNLPQFGIIQLEQTIKILINSSGVSQFNKNKRKSNARLMLAKLNLVEHFVITYKDADTCDNQIIKWGIEGLSDPNSDVKTGANKLLLVLATRDGQIYQKIKQQIYKADQTAAAAFQEHFQSLMESHLSQSRQNQQNSKIQQQQHEQDIHKKQTMKMKKKKDKQQPDQYIEYSIDQPDESLKKINESPIASPHRLKDSEDVELAYSQESMFQDQSHSHQWFANKDNENSKDLKVMNDFDDDLEGLCDYCFKQVTQVDMRDHLLETCPVVVRCQFCRGAIYLRQLTEHLLTACKKKHQQCPRCLLAFQHDEINDHRAQGVCRKSRGDMERCPFCSEDLQPEDLAWVEHSQRCKLIVKNPQMQQSSLRSQEY